MRFKKRHMIVCSVAAFLVVVAGLCVVSASGDRGFCGRGPHPPFFKKAFPEQMLRCMDKKMAELNLSETQKEKYAQLRSRFKTDFEEMRSRRQKFINNIRTQIDRPDPDMQRLADMVKERLKEMPGRIGTHLDQLVEFYNILNKDQKARVLERMRQRVAGCQKMMSEN